jgi:hypothetical protein
MTLAKSCITATRDETGFSFGMVVIVFLARTPRRRTGLQSAIQNASGRNSFRVFARAPVLIKQAFPFVKSCRDN